MSGNPTDSESQDGSPTLLRGKGYSIMPEDMLLLEEEDDLERYVRACESWGEPNKTKKTLDSASLASVKYRLKQVRRTLDQRFLQARSVTNTGR